MTELKYGTHRTNKFTGIHPTNLKQRCIILSFVFFSWFWFSCSSLKLEDSHSIAGWHRSQTKSLYQGHFSLQSESFQFNGPANHIISMIFIPVMSTK